MKKRLLPLMLALALCLGLAVPALAAEKEAEEAYEVVIPCELVNVGPFFEGRAWVDLGDTYGFIDKTGEVVIPGKYLGVGNFSEGLAPVAMEKDKWGYIDQTGKEVIPCAYDDVFGFSEGLALAVKDGKGGYIDKTGKEVIPFQYEGGTTFSDGLALVQKSGKWGFIDKTGEEVVSCQFEGFGNFSNGLAAVQKGGKWGYIDKTGKEIVPFQYTGASNFSEGMAIVEKGGKWGFIDQTGKEVISCQYDDAWNFYEGFAPVMQKDKWGYINQTGEVVVPFIYDQADTITDGLARVGTMTPVSGLNESIPLYGYIAIRGVQEPVTAEVSSWAKELVDSAAANGLIADGLGENYRVDITRAQFAAVTVKLYEAMSGETAPAAGESPFSDTADPAVLQAAALGFVGGVGDGKFDPDATVTREQAAVMLSRVYTKLGGEIPAVEATEFADNDAVGGYARDAVAFMSGKEIVGGVGDNKFDPKGSASIEQALVIALRMFENLK